MAGFGSLDPWAAVPLPGAIDPALAEPYRGMPRLDMGGQRGIGPMVHSPQAQALDSAMKALLVPETPLDVGLMMLGGPFSKAAKGGAVGLGAALTGDWFGGDAGQARAGGMSGLLDKAIKGIRAYHGSPHDFDRFDISKIGTGEGAQAYGHGLYFAENPGVALDYKRRLSAGNDPAKVRPDDEAIAAIRPQWDEIVSQLRAARERSGGRITDETAALQNKLDALNDNAAAETLARKPWLSQGRMYEVNINAKPDDFLNWDVSLRAQNPAARKLLNREFGMTRDDGSLGDFYHHIERNIGVPAPEVSQIFKEAGVPGIRYLDQASRGLAPDAARGLERAKAKVEKLQAAGVTDYRLGDALQELQSAQRGVGDMTSNYVLFDDKLVDILKKYGLPGIPAAGAASMFGSLDGGDGGL